MNMKHIRLIFAALTLLLVLPMTGCGELLDRLYEPGYARLPEHYRVFEVYDMEIAPDHNSMADFKLTMQTVKQVECTISFLIDF